MEDFEDIFGIIKRLLIVTEVSKQTIQDCIVITILNKICAPHLYMYLTPIKTSQELGHCPMGQREALLKERLFFKERLY